MPRISHMRNFFCALAALSSTAVLSAQTKGIDPMDAYARQIVFDNSIASDSYFYAQGKSIAPSSLELVQDQLPVVTSNFVSAPNALRLHWTSKPRGVWSVDLRPASWANRNQGFAGSTLSFWVYTENPLASSALPKISLQDAASGFTHPLAIGTIIHTLPVKKWTRVLIPIARFQSASLQPFDLRHLAAITLTQDVSDEAEHTLLLDEVRVLTPSALDQRKPAAPTQLMARGFERHVELAWHAPNDPAVSQFVIYRSTHGGTFEPVGTQRPGVNRFVDFIGDAHADVTYRVTARTASMQESSASQTASAKTHPMSDEALLDMVQEASFRYYWDGAEPNSGMALESIPGDPRVVAAGATGFGVMSMVVAADRKFVPRDQVVDRLLHITNFLAHADRFHGVWPHYLNGRTGHVMPVFGMYDDGADLVETSFLMQGLLAARGYFTGADPKETELRQNITQLWEGIEWNWFLTPTKDAIYWHWSPRFGFYIANRLEGYNESMITYMLAISSPTHGVPASLYYSGWEAQTNLKNHPFPLRHTYYGITVDANYTPQSPGPLFFTHYNFFGVDPHFSDRFTNWFTNGRNISLVHRRYAMDNPGHFKGYGADGWGLSAVTGPHGYGEFKPFQEDDGTLAPTGSMGAYAYTPKESLEVLKHFYRDLGADVWDVYGFRNAFNQQQNWYSPDELGLNQAPQTIMIENGRTGLIWRSFMSNPEVQKAMQSIGLKQEEH